MENSDKLCDKIAGSGYCKLPPNHDGPCPDPLQGMEDAMPDPDFLKLALRGQELAARVADDVPAFHEVVALAHLHVRIAQEQTQRQILEEMRHPTARRYCDSVMKQCVPVGHCGLTFPHFDEPCKIGRLVEA